MIISTVLPGTIRREILPWLSPHVKLCYNPFFIAMGTTIRDFLAPEFVLFGMRNPEAAATARELYRDAPRPAALRDEHRERGADQGRIQHLHLDEGRLRERADGDLSQDRGLRRRRGHGRARARDGRLLSPRYMGGGMGDGGGCHPRDNIALSWLARELDLSYDWFESVMTRTRAADRLARRARRAAPSPTSIRAQPCRHLRAGLQGRHEPHRRKPRHPAPQPARGARLRRRDVRSTRRRGTCPFDEPAVYFVATRHDEFASPDLALSGGLRRPRPAGGMSPRGPASR